ncbi:MAG: glycosyltransferase family 2 protein [Chloroflexota bacterium]|nr:glycosyltransferase family 2 protein [Chloroflexota bacterium]
MKLSPIIACYRDAEAVPHMYRRLVETFERIGCDYEIIFVNDASPDDAREVLARIAAADPNVVVINHARNFGSQSAFTSGMAIATGDACILLDGDLQDPPELIEQFVERWKEGYDVVYGERVGREAPPLMRVFYKGFYRAFRRAAYVNVPLDAGDFSLIDRRVVDALIAMPERQRFVRGLRAWVGFKQTGVPYVRPERMFGITTNSFRRNLGWARRAIVSFSYAPLDFITGLALSVVALSAFGLVAQVALKIIAPDAAPQGVATVITLILFIGGIQLLCLAIIGSYIAHMYEEVKGRPAYIVDSVLNAPDGAPLDPSALERGRHELRGETIQHVEAG